LDGQRASGRADALSDWRTGTLDRGCVVADLD
jgi:hypothetical protein